MSKQKTDLAISDIENYLQNHPDFFHEHLHLLETMSIPHPSGTAISLVSKQLELFRNRHHELEKQLNTLIDIARENDTAFFRMHKLTLALLEASTLEQAIANIEIIMSEYFLTDFVAVRIIKNCPESPISNLFVKADSKDLQPFLKELTSNQPKCGRPTLAQAKVLFGDSATKVKSCAIIPMNFTELEGILAIGSREEDRFHFSMGNLFLTQMSEIIATRLISLLRPSANA